MVDLDKNMNEFIAMNTTPYLNSSKYHSHVYVEFCQGSLYDSP